MEIDLFVFGIDGEKIYVKCENGLTYLDDYETRVLLLLSKNIKERLEETQTKKEIEEMTS